jgi:hypothetical protein
MDDYLPQCSKCGYDLLGLPERGGCPECGNPYNLSTGQGMVRPVTPEERGAKLLGRLRTITLLGMAGFVILCSGLLSRIAVSPRKPLAAGALVAGLLIVLGVLSIFVERQKDE